MSSRQNPESTPQPSVRAMPETPRCAFSEDGRIVYANPAFFDLIGVDETDSDSINIFDIFGFDDKDLSDLEAGERRVAIKGTPIKAELYFDWLKTPNQSRYLIASGLDSETAPKTDDIDGLLRRIQASAARIEKNNTALKDSGSLGAADIAAFSAIVHDVLAVIDQRGKIISANSTFRTNFAFGDTAPEGVSFVDMFAEPEKHQLRTLIQGLSKDANAQPTDFESRMTGRDGQEHWVEWRLKSNDGRLYAAGRDITAIKARQNDLVRQQRQLSEAEAIGRMGHWHWLIGDEHISWSEEIYRIFGVDQVKFEPTINHLMDLVHKRDLGRVVQIFQRAMIEEKNYDMEFRITRPDGEIRFILCEGRCEKDASGEVIALYGIVQDMTERVLYEEELRHAKNASEQAYAAKSQFLANMSHELRTPLNAIIGFSEMIEQQMLGPIFNEKYLDYAMSIRESGEHLLDLISDILDMSKIEAGKHTLEIEKVHVNDVLRRAMNMVEARAKEKNVTLHSPDFAEDAIEIMADRRALMQIFLNLLANAVKFTPDRGSVWVEFSRQKNSITFKVRDTGIGIPANKLAAVLRPFEQAASHFTREYEGTGLGLSITKELVELHGGNLSIDSVVGIGTTVSFQLPLGKEK